MGSVATLAVASGEVIGTSVSGCGCEGIPAPSETWLVLEGLSASWSASASASGSLSLSLSLSLSPSSASLKVSSMSLSELPSCDPGESKSDELASAQLRLCGVNRTHLQDRGHHLRLKPLQLFKKAFGLREQWIRLKKKDPPKANEYVRQCNLCTIGDP